jgi:hypothetical protein
MLLVLPQKVHAGSYFLKTTISPSINISIMHYGEIQIIIKKREQVQNALLKFDSEAIEYAVNNNDVSLCLVDEKSRFARNKYIRVVYEEQLRKAGVKLVGISEPDYD